MVNGAFLESCETSSGIPQGTCLGPVCLFVCLKLVLFLIYIHDMSGSLPHGVHCTVYADDSNRYPINVHKILQ